MTRKQIFTLLAVWSGVMLLAALLVATQRVGVIVTLLSVLLLFVVPFRSMEVMYDFVDKVLDVSFEPEKKLHKVWHFVFGIFIASVFFVLWPPLIEFLVENPGLYVDTWIGYLHPLDRSVTLFGYPAYAIELSMLVVLIGYAGYLFEMASNAFYARSHKK